MTEETKMILKQLEEIDAKITDIQMILENETNRKIKLIAEGHLDFIRNPDEALKVENEKEILLIRVHYLEREMRLGELKPEWKQWSKSKGGKEPLRSSYKI